MGWTRAVGMPAFDECGGDVIFVASGAFEDDPCGLVGLEFSDELIASLGSVVVREDLARG